MVSWSRGKDSTWTLHVLRQQTVYDVVGVVTTINVSAEMPAPHVEGGTALTKDGATQPR
jgi:hypothetical protein